MRISLNFLRRPARIETLVALVALYLMATANSAWWMTVWTGRRVWDPANWFLVACTFIALAAAHFVLLAPFCNRWTVRPLLSVVVVAAMIAGQFTRSYSVFIDPTMMQNILNTDKHEVRDLITWNLVLLVTLASAPALAVIWLVQLVYQPWLRTLAMRALWMVAALGVAVLALLPVARDLTSMMRNEPAARYLITPANLIYGLISRAGGAAHEPSGPRVALGTDAHITLPAAASRKPRLLVLVVGETARAANFSLFGYQRATNPQLAKREVLTFSNVHSCGTSTEVSLPCMFSRLGRADYNEGRIRNSEGLLDVLLHAGYQVKWIDNQSGCKGVCQGAGIAVRKIDVKSDDQLCKENECHDEVLARQLQAELAGVDRDTVLVLHMMGNHGPAYYRRYPDAYRRFVPDCPTAQLRDCSRDQVVNSYDNAILYTDFVLAKMVDLLTEHSAALDAAMIYVSDHGESLGEGGLYLHGIPYAIAPSVQTHVPMVAWLSSALVADDGIDVSCARGRSAEEFSHDNLFDTALGLLAVQTTVYRPASDIFAPCRARKAS